MHKLGIVITNKNHYRLRDDSSGNDNLLMNI